MNVRWGIDVFPASSQQRAGKGDLCEYDERDERTISRWQKVFLFYVSVSDRTDTGNFDREHRTASLDDGRGASESGDGG